MFRSLIVALVLATTLLACGSLPTATGPEDADAPDPEASLLAFARCMRENGIDMPDPGPEGDMAIGGEVGQGNGTDPRSPAFQAAEEACSDLLEDAMGQIERPGPEQQAEMQEQLLAFARCMRDHGIDFPDPQFRDGMALIGPSEGAEFDPEDPEILEAQKACEELLPVLEAREGAQ